MTPPRTNPELLAVLESRIDSLDCTLAEIKNLLVKQSEQRQAYQEQSAINYAQQQAANEHTSKRIEALEADQRAIKTELAGVKEKLSPLIYTNQVLVWLAGILAALIVGLIWAILTNQVTITATP